MFKTYRVDLSTAIGRIPLTRTEAEDLPYMESHKVRNSASCLFASTMTAREVEEVINNLLVTVKAHLLEESIKVLEGQE